MQRPFALLLFVGLAACGPSSQMGGGFMRDVPDDVVAIAAPGQNLQAVQLKEEDNCFWYQHVGPVETTMLPLRSKRGRHICMREAAA